MELDNMFEFKNIDSHQDSSNEEDTGFSNENCIAPETFHCHRSIANKVGFSEGTHENAVGDQGNNSWDFYDCEFHQHVDSVTEDDHDGDTKNSIVTDSFNEEKSDEAEKQTENQTSKYFHQKQWDNFQEWMLFVVDYDLICKLENKYTCAIVYQWFSFNQRDQHLWSTILFQFVHKGEYISATESAS